MGDTTRRAGWFGDCDVILRRGGTVSGWRMGRGLQVAGATALAAGLIWSAVATVGAWHFRQEATKEGEARIALEWKAHELREATDRHWARLDELVREVERRRGDAAAMATAEAELRRAIAERESRLITDTEARIAGIRTRLAEERRDHADALGAMRARAEAAEQQRDRVRADLDATRQRADAAATEARARLESERRALLSRLESEQRAAAARLDGETASLVARHGAERRDETARHDAERLDLEARLARAEATVADLSERNRSLTQQGLQARGDAGRLQGVVARLLQERGERAERAAALQREAEIVADRAETYRTAADGAARDLTRIRAERDEILAEAGNLRGHVQELEERLVVSQISHRTVMEGLGARARDRLGAIERVVAATGLDIEKMLAAPPPVVAPASGAAMPPPLPAARRTGAQGGPFIPAPEPPSANGEGYSGVVMRLDRDVERLERMERVLATLPLGAPLARYALESGFGRRVDQMARQTAMHTGVDLSAPMRTPIHATGGGKVVHAGWMSAYGRTVDIDHGNGLRTRYAHLSSIDVDEGQAVARGDVVGRLGATGRTTGAHLHYEVMVNGVAVDPVRFMEGGSRVRKSR